MENILEIQFYKKPIKNIGYLKSSARDLNNGFGCRQRNYEMVQNELLF